MTTEAAWDRTEFEVKLREARRAGLVEQGLGHLLAATKRASDAAIAYEEAVMRSNTSWLITRLGDPYGVNLSTPLLGHRERHAWERSGLALALVKRLRDRAPLPAPPGVWRTASWCSAR